MPERSTLRSGAMENLSPEIARIPNTRSRKSPWAGTTIFAVPLLMIALAALMWFHREALLRYAAEQWVVSDDIHPADVIVILGGGLETRPFAAAEDYRNGLAHKVLVANVPSSRVETLGILPAHTAINRRVLIKLGVPETDIESMGTELSTTYEEGQALRDWAVRAHANSVIVPIEAFSSRRVRWTLTQALAGTGTSVQIQMLHYLDYNYVEWWKTHAGLIAFQNEVMKYLYYRYKH
jgi:uncharacterized SAM-binding protein YcdF (DUF218 family)